PSAEERLQLETYANALSRYLEQGLGTAGPDEHFLQQLRQEFRVTPAQHQAVLDGLLRGGESESAVERMLEALRTSEQATQSLRLLDVQASPTVALVADLLSRLRQRSTERLLRGAGVTSQQITEQLESDDETQHEAAIDALCAQLPPALGERL